MPPQRESPPVDATKRPSELTAGQDLRTSTRYSLRCPVTLELDGKKYRGETMNISANGVLVSIQCQVATGSSVHYTIELPGGAFGINTPARVNCQGRVIRSSPGTNCQDHNIAIVIDDYDFEPLRKRPLLNTA